MVQVTLNGVAVGHLSEANARIYLTQTRGTIVSQTATTINVVKG